MDTGKIDISNFFLEYWRIVLTAWGGPCEQKSQNFNIFIV